MLSAKQSVQFFTIYFLWDNTFCNTGSDLPQRALFWQKIKIFLRMMIGYEAY